MVGNTSGKLKIWLCGLLLSCVASFGGVVVAPHVAVPGKGMALWVVLGIGLLCAAALLAAVFLCVLQSPAQETGFARQLGGGLVVVALTGAAALAVSLLYGLLAVLLQAALTASLGFAGVKQVISIVTGIITVLVLPVLLAGAYGYAYHGQGALAGIKAGLKGLRYSYWKLLCILAAGYLLGYGIHAALAPGSIFYGMATGIKVVLFGLLGTVALVLSAGVCRPKKHS